MTDFIKVELNNGVLIITLDRPDKKNAITTDMYHAMTDAVRMAQNDQSVRSILWRAKGNDFCSGNDLMDFMSTPSMTEDAPVIQFIYALADNAVPMVAEVKGRAVGIGATLLLHCDATVLGEQSTLIMPFTKLGLIPEAGCTQLLTELVGYQRAVKIAILGDSVKAEEALLMGLVTQVTSDESLPKAALELATRFADLPMTATRQARKLMRPEPEKLKAVMLKEAELFGKALTSEATKEAFTAHFEKRAANFRSID